MPELKKAFVVGGFSESSDFLWGLGNEIAHGPHKFVDEAETLTWAEAMKRRDAVNAEAARRVVLVHSAGAMAIRRAGLIIALNGVEPTPLLQTIQGGRRVAEPNVVPDMATVRPTDLNDGVREVLMHPSSWTIPWRARHFSTIQRLIDNQSEGGLAFPGGRVYLPTDRDEFGFGLHGEIERAQSHGIAAELLPGYHNEVLLRPREGAEQILRVLGDLAGTSIG